MPDGLDGEDGGGRVWPGIIPPLGLTLILSLSAWLFLAKVEADQKTIDLAESEREKLAQRGAKAVLEEAETRLSVMAAERLAARGERERGLRLETRNVLDAVHRLLASLLDKSGRIAADRRQVGHFPPGLDAARKFLEIPPPRESEDAALAAIRSSSPELAALLPAGCHLAVIEDFSRELLSLGGVERSEKRISAALTREFILTQGQTARNWTLKAEMSAPDENPPPTAAETAKRLSEPYPKAHGDAAGWVWAGWLIGSEGTEEASFAPAGSARDALSLPELANEWTGAGGNRMAWLEIGSFRPDLPWRVAVAAATDRPGPPLEPFRELWRDSRWAFTLHVLAFFTLAGWLWFLRGFAAPAGERGPPVRRPEALHPHRPRTGLRKDPGLNRDIPEDVPVILADIGDAGAVTIQAPPAEPHPAPRQTAMPSGSLSRLQSIHRGGEARKGTLILDQAKSPVLRELADRVRSPRRKMGKESTRQRRPPARHPTKGASSRSAARTEWRAADSDAAREIPP